MRTGRCTTRYRRRRPERKASRAHRSHPVSTANEPDGVVKIDFSALAPLIAARKRMGAPLREIGPVVPEPIAWPEDEDDVPIHDRADVGRALDGRIVVRGRYAIVYIQDTWDPVERLRREPESSKKYHLYHCRTLEQMLDRGRFERYVATDRRDGAFSVHSRERDGTRRTIDARLAPCWNCMILAGHAESPATFDLGAFFERNGDSPRRGRIPSTRDTDGRSSDYGPGWRALSQRLREEACWCCSECGVCLEAYRKLLHVHHVNGVKSDDRPVNLKVLCVLCHRAEPNHQHLKVDGPSERLIRELRLPRPTAASVARCG